jgi:capsular exopolysaccharide synthesis family protein
MEIDHLFSVLWRRRWSFLIVFLLVLGSVAFVTFQLPKVYFTSSYLLVSPREPPSSSFETAQVSETLTSTYGELLQTQRTAQQVQQAVGPDLADGDVGSSIDVEFGDSQLIKITAQGRSPREAQAIANNYASVFAQGAEDFSNVEAASGVVTVAQTATLPRNPSRPRPKLYLGIGIVLAALAGVAMALLRQRLDQRLDITATDTELLGLPIICRIPDGPARIDPRSDGPGSARAGAQSAEAFRLLLFNLAFANLGDQPASVAVVSASEREGKSTCALSLARAASETGVRTLAVDTDLRRPTLAEKLSLPSPGAMGVSNLLADSSSPLADAAVTVAETFAVLPAGPLPPNPAALLAGPGFGRLDERAVSRYDLVVYDTPPLSVAADASLVAARAEGVILVVDARSTKRNSVVQAIDQLRRARVNLLGVVLNRVSDGRPSSYYYRQAGKGAIAPTAVSEPPVGTSTA